MNNKQRQVVQSLPYVLDAFTVYPDRDETTIIAVQCTPHISIRNRRIYLNFWDGAWYFTSIPIQDIEMRALEGLIETGAEGLVQSTLLHAAYLYSRDEEQVPVDFDTGKGLLAVYLNLDEWNEFVDNKRKCSDLHKTYLILRHQQADQPLQDLDIWKFTDHKETLWATIKSMREEKLY